MPFGVGRGNKNFLAYGTKATMPCLILQSVFMRTSWAPMAPVFFGGNKELSAIPPAQSETPSHPLPDRGARKRWHRFGGEMTHGSSFDAAFAPRGTGGKGNQHRRRLALSCFAACNEIGHRLCWRSLNYSPNNDLAVLSCAETYSA